MSPSNRQSTTFWHERFLQQAGWTESIRQKLLGLPDPEQISLVLEVGSGTGVIVKELINQWPACIIGLDLDLERLKFGQQYAPGCLAVNGNGLKLPFMADCVDLAVCHYLLLWVGDPLTSIRELVRVTRPQGWVMALAEPDYGGRIDHPSRLIELGQLQIESLRRQGADIELGRKLMSLMLEAGMSNVRTGILGGEWQSTSSNLPDQEKEWNVLVSDLADVIDPTQLTEFRQDWLQAGRVLYVPTFYAFGKVPS